MKYLLTLFIFCFTLCNLVHAGPLSIQRFETQTGVPVVFYEAADIPMLNISLAFRAGSAYDDKQFGLSALTTRLLNQGNDGLDANTLANLLAETGAQFSTGNNQDMVILKLKTLTEKSAYTKATTLLTRIIKHPDFPEKAFIREKQQQQIAIRQSLERPNDIATQAFFQALYQTHPYAHPINGTPHTVNALSRKAIKQFHHDFFVRENAYLVLVGALNLKEAKALAETLTSVIPNGKKAPDLPNALPLNDPLDVIVPFTASQTFLRLGQLGITHHDKAYFPLLVGNYTLGGDPLVSQLAIELREKRGLTYGVTSQFLPMPERGPFMIGFSTKTSQAKTAEALTTQTLSQFIKTGPSEAELKAAKAFLIGNFPLAIAGNENLSTLLLKMAFYGLPHNYLDTYTSQVRAVTKEAIQESFQAHIQPDKLLHVMVGNP